MTNSHLSVTPEMDRANGLVFMVSYVLIFLASPVLYIGVVQAALCDKLGASAMVSDLPAAVYLPVACRFRINILKLGIHVFPDYPRQYLKDEYSLTT